jgi:hypothetical protein
MCCSVCEVANYVRLWHKADSLGRLATRLLLGGKRTSLIRSLMSANDPKRTFAGLAEAMPPYIIFQFL